MVAVWSALFLLFSALVADGVVATNRESRQFKDLEVQEPKTEFEADGGKLEMWRGRVFEDADVAAAKTTLRPRGLWLPSYVDSPTMQVVTRGTGRVGIIPPYTDRRIRETTFKVSKGDVVAVPEGTTIWWYNDSDEDLEVFGAADVTESPHPGALRAFHLAGGREGGRRRDREEQQQQQQQQQQGYGSVLQGFNAETLSRAWDMSEDQVRRVLESQTQTGIIRLEKGIKFPEDRTGQFESDDEQNTYAAANFLYRFAKSHPDVRVQNGGQLRELNSFKLPVLRYIGLSMECMQLEKNAMVAPNYFHKAHQVLYVVEGRGRVEVVSNEGRKALDAEVEEGSLVIIPAFYPSAKIASENDNFHYISVVTTHRPMITYLAGRNNVYEGIPTKVLSGILNVDKEQASQIQRGREDQAVILPPSQGGRGKQPYAAW